MNKDRLLEEALHLRPLDRVKLADSLYQSVELVDDQDVEASWLAEIERRASDVDEGRVQLIDEAEAVRDMFGGRDQT